ncbi:MAG: DUF4440 domain-containing protein [Planctomycetota bacterium]
MHPAAASLLPRRRPRRRTRGLPIAAAGFLLLLPLLSGCAGGPGRAPIDVAAARRVLDAQVARWNAGDLRAFVDTYWDGAELTFFGAGGLRRGRDELLAAYERGYPTAERRGVLSFEVVDFAPLGRDHALLLGRYHLERAAPASGVFSLVLARQGGRIVILHDHTTESAPPTEGG